ncbi:hypothetical protein H4582DRAFT_2049894, partial [Lactarius indigo]
LSASALTRSAGYGDDRPFNYARFPITSLLLCQWLLTLFYESLSHQGITYTSRRGNMDGAVRVSDPDMPDTAAIVRRNALSLFHNSMAIVIKLIFPHNAIQICQFSQVHSTPGTRGLVTIALLVLYGMRSNHVPLSTRRLIDIKMCSLKNCSRIPISSPTPHPTSPSPILLFTHEG